MEGAELVAIGLGFTALGFLASRLLRFWLLAMLLSVLVGELGNPDVDQPRKPAINAYELPRLPGRWPSQLTSLVIPPADHRFPV